MVNKIFVNLSITKKWDFQEEKKDDEGIKYKARLVVRGFELKCCDSDVYAPMATLNTFRIFMAVATKMNLNIQQLDVCNAFLNGRLQEEVYLHLPDGLKTELNFCRLNKSLYGLKISPNIGTILLMR